MNKLIAVGFALSLLMIPFSNELRSQAFRISAFGQESLGLGDFGEREFNNPDAAYANYGAFGALEFNYYIDNKIGVGIRWTTSTYGRDQTAYEIDLRDELNIVDDNYYLSQPAAFLSVGTDVGFSYLIKADDLIHIEPYLFFGFRTLSSRNLDAIYTNSGNTFQFMIDHPIYFGFSYSPGVKVHLNVTNRLGFFISGEYQTIAYGPDFEEQITSSATTLEVRRVEREYQINTFNIGLGVSYKLGKIESE